MKKAMLALATVGIIGAAMAPTGAQAMVPNSTTKMSTGQTTTTTTGSEARLNREKQMLRRDVRLHRTGDAARLRREISADERSISRAKTGGGDMQIPPARNMQPSTPTNTQTPSAPLTPPSTTQGTQNK